MNLADLAIEKNPSKLSGTISLDAKKDKPIIAEPVKADAAFWAATEDRWQDLVFWMKK